MHFTKKLPVKINKVVLYLTISDVLILSAWGLISPFLAIFMSENIANGSITTAGYATTIYLVVRGVLQVPASIFIDRVKGNVDDYIFVVTGSLLTAISSMLFVLATSMTHVYLIQIISAIGGAISYPAWYALFSKSLDRHNTAFSWTMYDTSISIGTAVTASLGGIMIALLGYETTFLVVATISIIGSIFLIAIRKQLPKC